MERFPKIPWIVLILATGCGTGGGGSGPRLSGGETDPVIPLRGTSGTYSRTPEEANRGDGSATSAPPILPSVLVDSQNHFIRLEFPFPIEREWLLDDDVAFAPFSHLNGQLTITDELGQHLPGIAVIDGVDFEGRDRREDPGWPEDLSGAGRDRNLGDGRFVYIATDPEDDVLGAELESKAAFGGARKDEDRDPTTTSIQTIRITLSDLGEQRLDAFWTINVGEVDVAPPEVLSIKPTAPIPESTDIDILSEFIVRFNEPMVPQSVGLSLALNPETFKANMPTHSWPNPPSPPFPPIGLSTPPLDGSPMPTPVFVPFDCRPLNPNNLAKYVIRPLIPLPPRSGVELRVRSHSPPQTLSPKDLRGNLQLGADATAAFVTGKGPGVVNAPVCPEVVYWRRPTGQGLGAIDLNGVGFTTNRPNAFSETDVDKTAIITNTAAWDPVLGRARDGVANNYTYPVGTGSRALSYGTEPGNSGTPLPGVNEKSDGFETLVKSSTGETNLTGGGDGPVGRISEMTVGDALDTLFYDTLNPFAQSASQRVSYLVGLKHDRNSISDPPTPNPPPLRYAVGLQPLNFVLDKSNVDDPIGLLIEGEEVFGIAGGSDGRGGAGPGPDGVWGTPDDGPLSRIMLLPNETDPEFGPDIQAFPFFVNGPAPQSSTNQGERMWTSRQQIGHFLYVADQTNKEVKILNSNLMRVLTSIPLPDPFGLGIAPDLKTLYVTNEGDDSVSVIGTDPFDIGFHEEVHRIPVGASPRAIAVQPDNEDVLVLNWQGDSMDIIDIDRVQLRKTVTALINKPRDIVVTDRQLLSGFQSGVYFAYIANFGANSVLVYESGPDVPPNAIGLDNILGEVPDGVDQGDFVPIIEPRTLAYDPDFNDTGNFASGCYVAHRDGRGHGIVSRIQFTWQAQFGPIPRNPPPGFYIPPGFSERRFEVVSQWGHLVDARLKGEIPTAIATSDLTTELYRSISPWANSGLVPVGGPNETVYNSKHPLRGVAAYFPDRLYIGFQDSDVIQVVDPTVGGMIHKTIQGTGPMEGFYGYWSQ